MVVEASNGAARSVTSADSWIVRVACCMATWLTLAAGAVGFDIIMDGVGWAADGLPDDQFSRRRSWPEPLELVNYALVMLFISSVLGLISGSILPRRIDPAGVDRTARSDDGPDLTAPHVLGHLVRRAVVATACGVAGTCAVITGALSVATDFSSDDSVSTFGAAGGLAYGILPAVVLAVVLGPIVGVAATLVIDRDRPRHLASTALVAVANVAASVIPLVILFAHLPAKVPAAVHVVAIAATLLSCVVTAEWLVRWRFVRAADATAPRSP